MKTGGLLPIEKELIRLSGKRRPRLLFMPTASSDSELYWERIDSHFSKKLGCLTDVLFLIKEKPSKKEIKEKIEGADIIYVGGGNTLKMMRLWRRLGVDVLLKKAWKNGTVLCGISAGSICWFDSGHSDSMSFYNPGKWKYINVRGLGLIRGVHCPHFNSSTLGVARKEHFRKMMSRVGGRGIAIDDNCAIEFIDEEYRVITSRDYAKAYRVFKKNGEIHTKRISQSRSFAPISELYESQ